MSVETGMKGVSGVIKGIVKRELVTFEVKDFSVSADIVSALADKGYDLETKAIYNDNMVVIGEIIKVCRTEYRY